MAKRRRLTVVAHFVAMLLSLGVLPHGVSAQEQEIQPVTGLDHTEPACWARQVPVENAKIEMAFGARVLPPSPDFSFADHPAAISPRITGAPTVSEDHTAWIFPVGLQPGRVYVAALREAAPPEGQTLDPARTTIAPPGTFLVFQTAGEVKPENAPPAILGVEIRQQPAAKGALTLLRVTFDRDMNPKSQGFIILQGDTPVSLAENQVAYDKKARSWQVSFAAPPGIISVRLNSETNIGFRGADPSRVPAWPVQLSFQCPFQGSLRQGAAAPGGTDD